MVDQLKIWRFIIESKTAKEAATKVLGYLNPFCQKTGDSKNIPILDVLPFVLIVGHRTFGSEFIGEIFESDFVTTLNIDGGPFICFLDAFIKIMDELNKQ